MKVKLCAPRIIMVVVLSPSRTLATSWCHLSSRATMGDDNLPIHSRRGSTKDTTLLKCDCHNWCKTNSTSPTFAYLLPLRYLLLLIPGGHPKATYEGYERVIYSVATLFASSSYTPSPQHPLPSPPNVVENRKSPSEVNVWQ